MRNFLFALALAISSICSVSGQSNISQNNLIQNGGFDSGGTGWSSAANAAYFYNNGSETILSIGWTNGCSFWQNTGATIQPGADYVLTIRAKVGQTPLTGVRLGLQDASAGWVTLSTQSFAFPETNNYHIFSMLVSSNQLAGAAGDTFGVAGTMYETPGSQLGWLWVDWLQLAPAVPQFITQPQSATNTVGDTVTLTATAVGAITNSTGSGSALEYQWYQTPAMLLPNATNASLTFAPVDVTDSGTYYVVATGPFGSAASSNVTLTVLPQRAATVTLDPTTVLVDSFDGWGTSLCWWANVCGGYSNRESYAQLAFVTLGLNIVRYNIGGGENPGISNTMDFRARMQGFEPTNGVWNWNADQNQRWMLKRAVQLGVNYVVAFANSPPWWMTVSGSVTGSTNGASDNLQTGYEDAFAQYLATVITNLTAVDGVKFDFVTPMNEPTANWWVYGGRQEGCHMDPAQQNRVVNFLAAELKARGAACGIDASEDNDEQSTINSVGDYDSTGLSNVTLLASHTYYANNPGGLKETAISLHKPLWISEYADSDATGMTMARRIHDDITQTLARAWIYWQVVDNYGGWGCLYNPEDGSGNTNYTFNEKFYVMWQFSHFIRPGDEIISAPDTNTLAAYDSTNHTLMLVSLNDSTNGFSYNYDLTGFSSVGSQVSRWRTSSSEQGASLASLSISNKQFTAYLAPRSVTTHVISNVFLRTQPTAWYPLDSNALDVSGNGNNALLATNVTYVSGKIGAGAAQFTGNNNSYIVIPRSISNSFTITCWVKTTVTGGGPQWWAGKGIVDGEVAGSTSDFGVSLVGGMAALGIGNPDTTILSTTPINDGQWHHLAAEWNSLTGLMRLYVDGQLQATGIGPTGTRSAPASLRLGSIQTGSAGGFLTGTMDDVRLFNRELSATEIIGTMNRAPTVSAISNVTILAGTVLQITNTASDPDLPAQTLSWSLLNAPSGATITPINPTHAVFDWRPAIAQSPSANNLGVIVSDNGTPSLDATQMFSVTVTTPSRPQISGATWTGQGLSFTVQGDAGPDYVIETATNLAGAVWLPVYTNVFASPPWQWSESATGHLAQQFYRIGLGP